MNKLTNMNNIKDGSLAVADGRSVIPTINALLARGFPLTVATRDWHPQDHISFASNHPPPNNKPFDTILTIHNPLNQSEKFDVTLWPDHCIAGTIGASIIPELNKALIDKVIDKGTDRRVEMFSAFHDPYETRVSDSGLTVLLKNEGITHVYVVGLAMDYCVKYTAMDAKKAGFETMVVSEGTKPVDKDAAGGVQKDLESLGIKFINMDGPEIKWLSSK